MSSIELKYTGISKTELVDIEYINIDGVLYTIEQIRYIVSAQVSKSKTLLTFDTTMNVLYNTRDKKEIPLTKIQKQIMKHLGMKSILGEYCSAEYFADTVWKHKIFSIYTLRNMIKHIRDKAGNGLIHCKQNHGYKVNLDLVTYV